MRRCVVQVFIDIWWGLKAVVSDPRKVIVILAVTAYILFCVYIDTH